MTAERSAHVRPTTKHSRRIAFSAVFRWRQMDRARIPWKKISLTQKPSVYRHVQNEISNRRRHVTRARRSRLIGYRGRRDFRNIAETSKKPHSEREENEFKWEKGVIFTANQFLRIRVLLKILIFLLNVCIRMSFELR